MNTAHSNHYEAAFESWLGENHIPFVSINQTRRLAVADQDLKSFDFLLWPDTPHPLLAEVKGRTFIGRSMERPVTMPFLESMENLEAPAIGRPLREPDGPYFHVWVKPTLYREDSEIDLDEETTRELKSVGYLQ